MTFQRAPNVPNLSNDLVVVSQRAAAEWLALGPAAKHFAMRTADALNAAMVRVTAGFEPVDPESLPGDLYAFNAEKSMFGAETAKCIGPEVREDAWAVMTVVLPRLRSLASDVGVNADDYETLEASVCAIVAGLDARNQRVYPLPVQCDALALIDHMITVLDALGKPNELDKWRSMCDELIAPASVVALPLRGTVPEAECNQLQLAVTLDDFGAAAAQVVGRPIRMWTEDVISDADLECVPWFRGVLENPDFRCEMSCIVAARNRLYHGHHAPETYERVYAAMSSALNRLAVGRPDDGVAFLIPSVAVCATTVWVLPPDSVKRLERPIVGRHAETADITARLMTPRARLLLYGAAGVGKSVLVRMVAASAAEKGAKVVLVVDASTDAAFRVELIRECLHKLPEHAAAKIRQCMYDKEAYSVAVQYLETITDWILCVPDATRGSTLLWALVKRAPAEARIVVAGRQKHLLETAYVSTAEFNLLPMSDLHLAILGKLDLFGGKEVTLPPGESEAALFERCSHQNASHCYENPSPDEQLADKETRRVGIERRLLEHRAMPPLQTLLRDRFLTQPRAVTLLGLILRSEPALHNVADLAQRHKDGSQRVDIDGFQRNQFQDNAYIELALSVGPVLDALRDATRRGEDGARGALVLLAVVAVLSRADTPLSLLEGGLPGLGTRAAVDRARLICARHGLIRLPRQTPGCPDDEMVGVMDPHLQRFLRYALVAGSPLGRELIPTLRKRLMNKFSYSRDVSPSNWPKLKRLEPCIAEWCTLALGGVEGPAAPTKTPQPVEGTVDDTYLLSRLGEMKLAVDFDPAGAVVIFRRVLTSRRRFLRLTHPQVAVSAYNLAAAYSVEKSRHSDARKLLAEAQSFWIKGMSSSLEEVRSDMAVTMAAADLGPLSVDAAPRDVDQAIGLETLSLQLVRRDASDQAPTVARAVSRLGRLHAAIGNHSQALDLHREALELRLAAFGQDNPQVAESFACIASCQALLNQPAESLESWEKALEIRVLWLKDDRPEVESTKSCVISALNVAGRGDDARTMLLDVLTRKNARRTANNAMAAPTDEEKIKPPPTPTHKDPSVDEGGASAPSSPFLGPPLSGKRESGRTTRLQASAPCGADSCDAVTAAPDKGQNGKKGSSGGGFMCASCRKRSTDRGSMQVCQQCKRVHYCSRKCQKKHWVDGGHKRFCKTLAERGTISVVNAEATADDDDPKHPCPICLTNEDDSGSAGMCYACGALFCGECNQPHKIGALPCPTCRHPLPTVSDQGRVELLHKLLKRSPGRHTAPALHLLGNAYANAHGTPQDLERALDLYQQAADLQSIEATITLGVCFERGEGTVEDHEEGVRLYMLAAVKANHRKAQFNLGNCFFVGKGVELNRMIAFQWFKRAADQGYADAQLCVGSCYERGAGVELDQSKAFEWFKKSAAQGNLKALHSVASSLLHGLGVPQDVAKAVAAFETPAQRGHPMSQFNLGVILYKGRDAVPQDLAKSIEWLRKAADQKHAGAQFNLGAAYSTGNGVPWDLNEAERLFALASEQGHELAKRYHRNLLANRRRNKKVNPQNP